MLKILVVELSKAAKMTHAEVALFRCSLKNMDRLKLNRIFLIWFSFCSIAKFDEFYSSLWFTNVMFITKLSMSTKSKRIKLVFRLRPPHTRQLVCLLSCCTGYLCLSSLRILTNRVLASKPPRERDAAAELKTNTTKVSALSRRL